MKFKTFLIIAFLLVSVTSEAQVLISILFGDKLNSEKIEFGLVGGFNRSSFRDIPESKAMNNFNIGFYFHFLAKKNSYISTGVLVKSNSGATGMPSYPIGDDEFDAFFADATLTTKINYFYVPVLFQQRFYKILVLEAGFQAGLRYTAYDMFDLDAYGGTVDYKAEVHKNYRHLDAGLLGGAGIKFKNTPKSMSAGVNFYYGLVNVSYDTEQKIRNSSLYVYFKIPIGVGAKPGYE